MAVWSKSGMGNFGPGGPVQSGILQSLAPTLIKHTCL